MICGCIATYYAFRSQYDMALAFIIGGAVFDFFDGFMARLLGVSSPIGKELDSLADNITFGFAPSAIAFALLHETPELTNIEWVNTYLPYSAFLISAFSALRLAKFNLDERQTTTFYGLPTPANALFWGALTLGFHDFFASHSFATAILLVGIVCSCWILNADIPMFALKFKHYGWRGNALRYSFILASAALLIALGWSGFSLVIVLYIATSLVNNAMHK